MSQSNKPLGREVAGWAAALVAIVIALLAWLAPFSPIGPSPIKFGTPHANQESPSLTPIMVTVVVVATTAVLQAPTVMRVPLTVAPPSPTLTSIPPTARPTITPVPPTPVPKCDALPNGECVSPESLARVVGGNASYWIAQGYKVWRYWNKDTNATFHHPGGNITLTYWWGFLPPTNVPLDCVIKQIDFGGPTRSVQCLSAGATFDADGVGLHLP